MDEEKLEKKADSIYEMEINRQISLGSPQKFKINLIQALISCLNSSHHFSGNICYTWTQMGYLTTIMLHYMFHLDLEAEAGPSLGEILREEQDRLEAQAVQIHALILKYSNNYQINFDVELMSIEFGKGVKKIIGI